MLLEYGEYNEQGDVSYTIANLEGSILFVLDLEVPPEARERWEKSSFAAANPAFTASHRAGRQASIGRDITEKYNSSQDPSVAALAAVSGGMPMEGDRSGAVEGGMKRSGNSTSHLPAFTELTFVAKSKDEHTEDDVIAMKQLGKFSALVRCLRCGLSLNLSTGCSND